MFIVDIVTTGLFSYDTEGMSKATMGRRLAAAKVAAAAVTAANADAPAGPAVVEPPSPHDDRALLFPKDEKELIYCGWT